MQGPAAGLVHSGLSQPQQSRLGLPSKTGRTVLPHIDGTAHCIAWTACAWSHTLYTKHNALHILWFPAIKQSALETPIVTCDCFILPANASHSAASLCACHKVICLQGTQLFIRSFELGVLFVPSLEAIYKQHPHRGFTCTPREPPARTSDLPDASTGSDMPGKNLTCLLPKCHKHKISAILPAI